MKLFRRKEKRSNPLEDDETSIGESLLRAFLDPSSMTKEKSMQIPTVAGTIGLISDIIAATPIELYEKVKNGKGFYETKEITDDNRTRLLNNVTGDKLSASDMWKAVIKDYYLGKGGYIFINRNGNSVKSLHYVDEKYITVVDYIDPIFKDYDIYCNGEKYRDFDFIKVLRGTKNGGKGVGIVNENNRILSLAYNSLIYEENLVKKGGNKKGFLKSENKLDQDTIDDLKESWKNLYSNNEENVVVLNKGIDFKESSNTSVEMQLNENKATNSAEIGKILHVSPTLLNGTSATVKPEDEIQRLVKLAVIPLMNIIESACNEDLLLEREKGSLYFAYDKKELLKGSMKDRFETYKTAIESKVLTIEEARSNENLEPIGLDFINLGLADVFYNPKTKEVFVPNTGESIKLDELKKGGEEVEN